MVSPTSTIASNRQELPGRQAFDWRWGRLDQIERKSEQSMTIEGSGCRPRTVRRGRNSGVARPVFSGTKNTTRWPQRPFDQACRALLHNCRGVKHKCRSETGPVRTFGVRRPGFRQAFSGDHFIERRISLWRLLDLKHREATQPFDRPLVALRTAPRTHALSVPHRLSRRHDLPTGSPKHGRRPKRPFPPIKHGGLLLARLVFWRHPWAAGIPPCSRAPIFTTPPPELALVARAAVSQ